MRRISPIRFSRHSPRQRYRPRSVSPLPKGRHVNVDDRSGRNHNNTWEEPNWRKGIRSRSRERISRDGEVGASRFFDSDFRSKSFGKESRKFIDSGIPKKPIERNPDFYSSKIENRNKKRKRSSRERVNWTFDGHINDMDSHNDLTSLPDYNLYMQQDDRQLEAPQPPSIEPYIRHSERNDESNERINRLEKLVEKLVEGNTKLPNQEAAYTVSSKDGVPELIPSNTKFTTSMWLNRIHEESIKKGFDENTVIKFTQDRMTGIMKSWFKSVRSYDFTWPELKLLITKTFPDNAEFATTLKLLVSRNKISDETITQYYFSKLYLCEACKITGENAVSCLIDGLTNPFMKQDIKLNNFLTPEALYSEYFSKFPENEIPVNLEQREVVTSYSNEDFIHVPPQPKVVECMPPIQSQWQITCDTCKKKGHTLYECRHAPICYLCKKKGHIKSKCPMRKINVMTISSNQGNLQTINCQINGVTYKALFDTGSEEVIITKHVMETLQLKLIPESEFVLSSLGSKIIEIIGRVTINMRVNKVEREISAVVIPNQEEYSVIIGQTFLNQNVGAFLYNGSVNILDLSGSEI